MTAAVAAETAVETLGLDPEAIGLDSPEALAESLRRAASFRCPTTPGALLREVEDALAGLTAVTDDLRSALAATLEALLSYGDLLELTVEEDDTVRRKLFLGPPTFVQRQSSACLLIGLREDAAPIVSEDLMTDVEHEDHVRLLRGEGLADRLTSEGLIELSAEQWVRAPRALTADELIADFEMRLSAARPTRGVDGVRIIDPSRPPTYYRGRWRELERPDSGLFVGRRPQAYGADIWCVLTVADGEANRVVDLPVQPNSFRGADEAWRLQAAVDIANGSPQRFHLRPAGHAGSSVLDLFSPIPSWAQRRLDVVGTPTVRSRGALFTWVLPADEAAEEVAFLKEMMWMTDDNREGQR